MKLPLLSEVLALSKPVSRTGVDKTTATLDSTGIKTFVLAALKER
jgi:hypothetical protein